MVSHPLVHVEDSRPLGTGSTAEGDLLVVTFHGASKVEGPLEKVMNRHEGKLDPKDRRVFQEYLDLEVDTFSQELARRVIEEINRERPQLFIRYLEIKAHRGILDGNRLLPQHACRGLWNPEQDQAVYSELEALHAEIMEAIQAAVPENRFESLLDIHTMWPFSPVLNPQEQGLSTITAEHGRLRPYIDAYTKAEERGGTRRPICLLETDGQGSVYGNSQWIRHLQSALSDDGYPVGIDRPYHFGASQPITGKALITRVQCRGINMDVPKHLLAEGGITHATIPRSGDLSRINLNGLAETIARSYLTNGQALNLVVGGWGQI